jgi:hypothetical protein
LTQQDFDDIAGQDDGRRAAALIVPYNREEKEEKEKRRRRREKEKGEGRQGEKI